MQPYKPFIEQPENGNLLPFTDHQAEESLFDVTAMIDVVSLMNIFFLVTFVGAAMGDIDLPTADHCKALDPDKASIITIVRTIGENTAVYIGDGKQGTPIHVPEDQESRIADAVRSGVAAGKMDVLFKADRSVRLHDIRRLAMAATVHEGIAFHFSVQETDNNP